jgi:hypothetical protein
MFCPPKMPSFVGVSMMMPILLCTVTDAFALLLESWITISSKLSGFHENQQNWCQIGLPVHRK